MYLFFLFLDSGGENGAPGDKEKKGKKERGGERKERGERGGRGERRRGRKERKRKEKRRTHSRKRPPEKRLLSLRENFRLRRRCRSYFLVHCSFPISKIFGRAKLSLSRNFGHFLVQSSFPMVPDFKNFSAERSSLSRIFSPSATV